MLTSFVPYCLQVLASQKLDQSVQLIFFQYDCLLSRLTYTVYITCISIRCPWLHDFCICGFDELTAYRFRSLICIITRNVLICEHVIRGVDSGRWEGPDPLKMCRRVGVCFDRLKCHTFIQNCWITLQVPHHQGWKTCVKNGRKTIFSRRLQAVRNRDCWVFGNHWCTV